MFSFPRFTKGGLSGNPANVAHHGSERDSSIVTEKVNAGLDSHLTSSVNPGELTFEEGESCWIILSSPC